MSPALAGILQIALLILALAICYKPLGDYIARVVTSDKDWRAERVIYRAMGVDSQADQRWGTYLRSMLAFSAISVLGVYLLERVQGHLFLSNAMPGVTPDTAWNTAVSFTANRACHGPASTWPRSAPSSC